MISVANIYKFSLPEEEKISQKKNIETLSLYLREYFGAEKLKFQEIDKVFSPNYSVKSFIFEDSIGKMHIFYTSGNGLPYYYPEVFCEIWLNENFLNYEIQTQRAIFFLSNIFECFEFLDEKNLMLEFHSRMRDVLIKKDYTSGKKKFSLRFDFIDIGEIGNLEEKYNQKLFEEFIEKKWELKKDISEIKNTSPENYRTLLVFLYHIFSLTKNLKRTSVELKKIRKYEEKNGADQHIDISAERLKMTQKSIETVLKKYKSIFEEFFEILTSK